ncbi:MAG: hypothetical protein H8D34_24960 [Chloroflexi bacterium]|nr:hypothetical protein [Chloroflexota bacterium]MBL7162845.1 hypothetical protein [Anaerolineales bacterium]
MQGNIESKFNRLVMGAIFVLAGITYVYFLGGLLRPNQNDSAHAIGIMTMKGGVSFHPAQYTLGDSLFGQFTLLLTAKVAPPVSGDLVVELSGPEQLQYTVSSRYPPGVPIINRLDRWYSFENETFKGVTSGSDLVVVIKIKPPQKPGEYTLTVTNPKSQQVYFQMPVIFSDQRGALTDEDCH